MKDLATANMRQSLAQNFSSFLLRRRAKQHFERMPLLATLLSPPVALPADSPHGARSAAAVVGAELSAAARESPAQALAHLKSQAGGLDAAEAARRLVRDGLYEVQHEAPLPGWLRLWRCYLNPFNLLLTALALLSSLSGDAKATVVIGVMVAVSTIIRFVQEGRSHRAAEGLRNMASNKASVIRRSVSGGASAEEIAVRDLVAGDVVALSAGDMIPAD